MGADQHFDWAGSTASILDWWQEAGVDTAIAEEPRNWLAPAQPKTADPLPALGRARGEAGPVEQHAPAPVPMPDTLADFIAWRTGPAAPDAGWPGAPLFAEGPAGAALMIAIEMPERDDERAGSLLSGTVGQLFDRMLAAIGVERGAVQLVPMCVKRPSTGRIPAETEAALAAALCHYVALAAPKRVLLFGNAVSRALLGADIAQRRGALHPLNQKGGQTGGAVHAVASFHPRFLLERPTAKAEAWKDLLLLIQGIDA